MITTIVVAVLGLAVGFLAGAITISATAAPPTQPELPEHQHLWGEWEQTDVVPVYGRGGRPVEYQHEQRRQCVTCGFMEWNAARL